jgi:hypothetical protein
MYRMEYVGTIVSIKMQTLVTMRQLVSQFITIAHENGRTIRKIPGGRAQ